MLYHKSHFESMPEEQYAYLSQFMKTSLDGIRKINNIPFVVYVVWVSHKAHIPPLNKNRLQSLTSIIKNIKVPVILLTSENYKCFEVEDYPIHPAFRYLSGNHKSDYLRAYMLHNHGGAYHDIKRRKLAWGEKEWHKLADDDVWMLGRSEFKRQWIAVAPGNDPKIRNHHRELVTMNWIIAKDHTPYTQELLDGIHRTLDKHYKMLEKYPAPSPRCCGWASRPAPKNSYPLRWLEVMGEIYHPLMFKYRSHIKHGLPDVIYGNYK